jgi:TonB family protein
MIAAAGAFILLQSGISALSLEPRSEAQPLQNSTPSGKAPDIVRDGRDGEPIEVPKFIVCDPRTFLNCHKEPGVTPPKLLHSVTAEYASEARRLHLEGMSVVKLIIDEKGRPQNVSIIRSFADKLPVGQQRAGRQMDQEAIEAVKRYRFHPATLNGQPVPTEVTIEVNFHLV